MEVITEEGNAMGSPTGRREVIDELSDLALNAARAGRDAMAAVLGAGALRVDAKSAGHDLVTSADQAAEHAVLGVLRSARPQDAVLAEEGGTIEGTTGVRWLVDPIDGTANFVHGRRDHAVSVGAEIDGAPAVGAVLLPATGQWVVTTSRGVRVGADVGPEPGAGRAPGRLTEPTGAEQALVTFGLPYPVAQRQQVLALIGHLVPHLQAVRVVGSAACDFHALVSGESDASVTVGLAEWDVAAGLALVRAAGGTWRRVPLGQDLTALVAGSAALVDDLVRLVATP